MRFKMKVTDIRLELALPGEGESYSAMLVYKYLKSTRCYLLFFTKTKPFMGLSFFKLCPKRTAHHVIAQMEIKGDSGYKQKLLEALDEAITCMYVKKQGDSTQN